MRLPVLALAAVLCGLCPGLALAADVSVQGDEVVVVGGPESSRLSIAVGRGIEDDRREYSLSDQGDTLVPGPGCRQGSDPRGVLCQLPGGAHAARIRADMGAGNDLVRADAFNEPPVTFLGGPDADFLIGGAGADRLDGGEGDDQLAGDEGLGGQGAGLRRPDELVGGPGGRDRVIYENHGAPRISVTLDGVANDGADGEQDLVHLDVEDVQGDPAAENFLRGDNGHNFLLGGPRNDVLHGGQGRDELLAGGGDDTLEARDAEPDRVSCGDGADRATIDFPADALEGCETTDPPPRPPQPDPGPPVTEPPPATGPQPPVTLGPSSVRPSRGGNVVLAVACAGKPGQPDCVGRLRVRSTKRVRLGKRRRVLSLGTKAYRIPAGATARVAFRLSRSERRALRRARTIKLRARAVESGAAQPRTVQRTLTLRRG